jgi:hypothetical protein
VLGTRTFRCVVRGWQARPAEPFEPGNTAAVTHGAYSPRLLLERASEIAGTLVEIAPWCGIATFAGTLNDLAFALAQLEVLRRDMSENGMLDDEREPTGSANFHNRVQGTVNRLRGELGLTPSAWSRLVQSLGSADGAAVERGIEALQRIGAELDRSLRALPGGDDDAAGE